MNDEALAALWQRSTTLDRRLVASIRQTFNSAADALTAVKAQATGKTIKDIDVSLLNMSVVTMSYESLLDVRSQYLKGNCEEVILGNLRAKASVCQTEEVLWADVVYKFGFEDGLRKHREACARGASRRLGRNRPPRFKSQRGAWR